MRCSESRWRRFALRRHGRDNDFSKVVVHFWWRYGCAGLAFLDLATDCGVEIEHPAFATHYQVRSGSSALANSPSIRASSFASASFLDASAHPDLWGLLGLRRTRGVAFDRHFRLVLQPNLGEQWLRNYNALGITYLTNDGFHVVVNGCSGGLAESSVCASNVITSWE